MMRDKILLLHRINIAVKSKGRRTVQVQIIFFIQSIFLFKGNLKFIFADGVLYYNNKRN